MSDASGGPQRGAGPPAVLDPLTDREGWLIRLRWLAISGVAATVGVAILAGWTEERWSLFLAVMSMAAYNQLFANQHARRDSSTGGASNRTLVFQILVDLAALTVLLHLSGGRENPFWVFFVFHMTIATMLLALREVLVLAGAAIAMHCGSVIAEYYGVLPHHHLLFEAASAPLAPLPDGRQFPALLVGHIFAFSAMVLGTIYFVYTVESERRRTERAARAKDRALAMSQRMARIGELSAGVAHTIRNPLHGVSNCVDLLKSELGAQGDSTLELFELVDEGLSRIERVTRRLLALTREQDGLAQVVDLEEVLADALNLATRSAAEHGVELKAALQPGCQIRVDPDRFVEAVMNLVDNAVAACEGAGLVEVGAEVTDQERIKLWVRDSGTGMDEGTLEQVFKPFFTTKEVGEGTGLGLAISRGVIEGAGGEIEASSTPGSGTVFTVYLPRSLGDE